MNENLPTVHAMLDRVTGQQASIFTPPEDLVPAPEGHPLYDGLAEAVTLIEGIADEVTETWAGLAAKCGKVNQSLIPADYQWPEVNR